MPALTIAPNGATTVATAPIAVANLAADGTIEVQYAIRPDWEFCVAPLVTGLARENFVLKGLNPGTVYYVRARARRAAGQAEDWSNTLSVRTADGAARNVSPASIMISPAMIVVPTPVLGWLGSTGGIDGHPLHNLGHDGPTSAAISTEPVSGSIAFIVELGQEPIDTIALLNTNAPADASIRIDAGNTQAVNEYGYGPVPFRASPNLPGRPGYHSLIELPAPQTFRYWHIRVYADVFGGRFEAQHAVFGKNRTTKNHAVDKVEAGTDLGSLERDRAGNPIRVSGARGRRVDFDLAVLTEAAYEQNYSDLTWRVGQTDPVLVVPNSKEGSFLHDRILYGALRGGNVVNPASPYYTRSFSVDSII